jgi:hypothetical protein
LPAVACALIALLALWVVLAPAESRLGNVVKLVFVHGALVWTGLLTFSVAGGLGLVALLTRRRLWYGDPGCRHGGAPAVDLSIRSGHGGDGHHPGPAHRLERASSAGDSPILAAALVLALVRWLVGHPGFSAGVNVIMGILPWVVVRQADAIRHPVDPIPRLLNRRPSRSSMSSSWDGAALAMTFIA